MSPASLLQQFHEEGVIRLRGAFARAQAAEMREAVWRHIERRSGVRRNDPLTWSHPESFGFRALEARPVWSPIVDNPATLAALDGIFGADNWNRPIAVRAQILLTFPSAAQWVMPRGWHIDFGFERPTWPAYAVKVFAFFDTVEPAGGGTLVLAGSHRLVERLAATKDDGPIAPGTDERLFERHPWLVKLHRGSESRAILDAPIEIDGIELRVRELTGDPGDVVLTHMHVFHSPAPNTSDRPRQMVGLAIERTASTT